MTEMYVELRQKRISRLFRRKVRASREINALAQSSQDTAQWIFDNYIPLRAVYLWCMAKWQWQTAAIIFER